MPIVATYQDKKQNDDFQRNLVFSISSFKREIICVSQKNNIFEKNQRK
jgi:hypothetical protein